GHPARERAHHPHRPEGLLQRDESARRGRVPRRLPRARRRAGAPGRLGRAGAADAARGHRPAAAQVRGAESRSERRTVLRAAPPGPHRAANAAGADQAAVDPRTRRRRQSHTRCRRLPERPAPARRRDRHRGARGGGDELHPELRRGRRRREREGHHPGLPLPAEPVRRPESPARRSGRIVVIPMPGRLAHGAPAAAALAVLLAAGGFVASPDPGKLVDEAARSMQKARETGDPTWYVHASGAVERALAIDPSDYGALRARAWVLLGMHEFGEARAAAERALAIEPNDFMNWANLTDALVELGDYPQAIDAADRLAEL